MFVINGVVSLRIGPYQGFAGFSWCCCTVFMGLVGVDMFMFMFMFMYVHMYLSIYLSIHPSIYIYIYIYIYI